MTQDDIKRATNKVGIVPHRWRTHNGVPLLELLIQLPNPKQDLANPGHARNGKPLAKEARNMRWGLARGTVRYQSAPSRLADIASIEALASIDPSAIADHAEEARREAIEELGLMPGNIAEGSWHDLGLLDYISPRNGSYPIHFFTCELKDNDLDKMHDLAEDTQALAWKTPAQIREMAALPETIAKNERFKDGYVDAVNHIETSIRDTHRDRAARVTRR